MSSENIYVQKMIYISHVSKYTKWYINIINNAFLRSSTKKQAKNILGYVEAHHIIPKCLFLKYKKPSKFAFLEENPNDKNNIAYLTGREHFICHMLLVKMFKDPKLKYIMAPILCRMKCNKLQYYNSVSYEAARKLASKFHHTALPEFKKRSAPSKLKNKTYEEFYGAQKALELKELRKQTFKSINRAGSNNSRFDNKIYTFINIETGQTYTSTRYDFYVKFSINKGGVCSMVNDGITYKKWKIL